MIERRPDFDPEQLKQAWERAHRDDNFWRDHFREFVEREEYKEKFVAVYDGNVVGVDGDLIKLMDLLKELGLDKKNIGVRFVTNNRYQLTGH